AAELLSIADDLDQPFVRALANQMSGAVLILEGQSADSLGRLREALSIWQDLNAPYEAARTRVHMARACEALGDEDGARMELDAASATFRSLGAEVVPDADEVLTPRELEVIALIARGDTNREIATELVISEKTVASHVGHILTKLGVSSRTAAAAYAFEHGLA
ncbi:MAG: response regulator transcription factor, partial [Acidimicrobiales bacterium]